MKFHLVIACILWVVLSALPMPAQKITGDISGDVRDVSGAVVPKATVIAKNVDTDFTRTVVTTGSGLFRIPELPIGTYKVSAAATGFKTTVRSVQVAAAGITHTDFVLQVGQRNETITVEGVASLVEYSDRLNSYVDESRIKELPLNGRDFNSILAVTPGVQRAPGGGFIAVNINGVRNTSNNYLVDGISNNDRFYGDSALNQTGVLGIPATLIPPDAIQEVNIQQSPSAEFGVKGGAAINLVMKSGTNDLHGSAYWFRHTDFADAANYFGKHQPGGCPTSTCTTPLRNMQYGGTLGGPIIKDKTFFFIYYEGQGYESKAPYQAGIPTQGEVNAAESAIANAGLQINPLGQKFLSFYPIAPTPEIRTGNVFLTTVNIPTVANMNSFSVKVDQKIGTKHSVSARYFFGDSLQSAPAFIKTIAPPSPSPPDLFNSVAPTRAQLAGATWTWTISQTKILESRVGMTRFSSLLDENNKINPASLGLDTGPLNPADYGWPGLYYFGDFGYTGGVVGYPLSTRPDQNYDWSEHFTAVHGNHTFKMGGNYQYTYTNSLRNRARSDLEVFPTDHVLALEELLLGRIDFAGRQFGDTHRHIFQRSLGLYLMDDWKVTPHLTLALGLRYEVAGAIGEERNRGSNFFPDKGVVDLGKDVSRLYDTPRDNFGPRIGFAWDVFGNGRTAVRGGYALTYDFPNLAAISAPQGNFSPFNVRNGAFTQPNQGIFSVGLQGDEAVAPTDPSATCVDPVTGLGNYVCLTPSVPIYGANPTGTPPFSVVAVVSPLRTPKYHMFHFSVQQEVTKNSVITAAYVGQRGRNLLINRDLNAFPLGCSLTAVGCVRPFATQFPNIEHIEQITNASRSWYDSLQLSFREQNWHRINTQYNLTWSKCFDYNSQNRLGRFTFSEYQNPFQPERDKGLCDHDVTLNFNMGGTYALPTVRRLGKVGDGWEFSLLGTVLSGRPFSAVLGSLDPSDQGVGSVRASYDGSRIKYNTRNPDQYVVETYTVAGQPDPCGDTSGDLPLSPFFIPCPGTVGNSRRNMLRGPGLMQWDGAIVKTTNLTEQLKLQFRWEVYNLLNRANFSTSLSFNNHVQNSTFGTISSTPDVDVFNPVVAQGGPRNMVFVVKFIF